MILLTCGILGIFRYKKSEVNIQMKTEAWVSSNSSQQGPPISFLFFFFFFFFFFLLLLFLFVRLFFCCFFFQKMWQFFKKPDCRLWSKYSFTSRLYLLIEVHSLISAGNIFHSLWPYDRKRLVEIGRMRSGNMQLNFGCRSSLPFMMTWDKREHRRDMSCPMTKLTKWHVRPAKTQISLGIRPVWWVFAVRMQKAWVLSYPLNAHADLSHIVGFVMSGSYIPQIFHSGFYTPWYKNDNG